MMTRSDAISKIKKCLKLSQSANEHEAALALKHAQALMRQFDLNGHDIALHDVEEQSISCPKKMPLWQHVLIQTINKAFSVAAYLHSGSIVFFGFDGKPELAKYAYEVLLRQIRKDRRHYMATTLKRVRITQNKNFRADEFCLGWIMAIHDLVNHFAMNEHELLLIEQYKNNLSLKPARIRKNKASHQAWQQSQFDQQNGQNLGQKAQLNPAVDNSARAPLKINYSEK